MNINNINEQEIVTITCTDTGVSSEAEIWKRHPNGDISMLLENSIKMHFKKYNGMPLYLNTMAMFGLAK